MADTKDVKKKKDKVGRALGLGRGLKKRLYSRIKSQSEKYDLYSIIFFLLGKRFE